MTGRGMSSGVSWLLMLLIMSSCATPWDVAPAASRDAGGPSAASPKRMTAVILSSPPTFSAKLNVPLPGASEIEDLVNAGMVTADSNDDLHEQLAESIPSLENGLWTLHSDGRMETVWKIRERAQWHDGAPFTSADLAFTLDVARDPDLRMFGDVAYAGIESVETPDPRTAIIRWTQTFIGADALFSRSYAMPLPRHLLEPALGEDKLAFTQLPYWNTGFVGTGPFRVREWVASSHVVMDAFDQFVFGRPKIDQVELRFMQDSTTVMANIFSGSVDLTLGRGLSIDQAIQAREQWPDGSADLAPTSWIAIYPQFINPEPALVADLAFRRALLHAIEREQMFATIQGGLVPVAHTLLRPNQPQYRDIEARATRYDYDPRRAIQLIEELGYRRDSDGAIRGNDGRRLSFEVRTFETDINRKTTFAVADYWQQLGLEVEAIVVPTARQWEREYMTTHPGFTLQRYNMDATLVKNMHSSRVPLPQNSFTGANNIRYISPELHALIERYQATVPKAERVAVMGQIIQRVTEQLDVMGLFYDSQPSMIHRRLNNARAGIPWNAHEWEIAS